MVFGQTIHFRKLIIAWKDSLVKILLQRGFADLLNDSAGLLLPVVNGEVDKFKFGIVGEKSLGFSRYVDIFIATNLLLLSDFLMITDLFSWIFLNCVRSD